MTSRERRQPVTLPLKRGRLGVLCLETTEWDEEKPEDRMSSRPLLALLERYGAVRSLHRDIATRAELGHYLERWRTRRKGNLRDYSFLYLAFHGDDRPGERGILVEDGLVSLPWIGKELEGKCRGTHIHFSTCTTLSFSEPRLEAFRQKTGAPSISGYSEEVDWIESATLDLMIMARLQRHRGRLDLAFDRLRKDAGGLMDRLGLVVAPSYLAGREEAGRDRRA